MVFFLVLYHTASSTHIDYPPNRNYNIFIAS
nr:MAG TPA: hypothetical protein [Bacteriophage sp.]